MIRQKTMPCNQELVDIFDELYSLYKKLGDEHRAFAFFGIARLIEIHYADTPITRGSELMKWHGVGKSTIDIVNDFLSTGRCHRFEELKASLDTEEDEDDFEDMLIEEFWDEHVIQG
jgi:DNA polymerase/3'-5' exonuclease PolX